MSKILKDFCCHWCGKLVIFEKNINDNKKDELVYIHKIDDITLCNECNAKLNKMVVIK